MDDIVSRLRSYHHENFAYGDAQAAADEIERLRAALQNAIAHARIWKDICVDTDEKKDVGNG